MVKAEVFDGKDFTVTWNGNVVFDGGSNKAQGAIVFNVTKDEIQAVNTLMFSCPDAVSPSSVGLNDDLRILGLAVEKISVWPTGEQAD